MWYRLIGVSWGLWVAVAATEAAERAPARLPSELRAEGKLQVGDEAPDFTLQSPDGKRQVTLSGFRGKRPVALVFGSYT